MPTGVLVFESDGQRLPSRHVLGQLRLEPLDLLQGVGVQGRPLLRCKALLRFRHHRAGRRWRSLLSWRSPLCLIHAGEKHNKGRTPVTRKSNCTRNSAGPDTNGQSTHSRRLSPGTRRPVELQSVRRLHHRPVVGWRPHPKQAVHACERPTGQPLYVAVRQQIGGVFSPFHHSIPPSNPSDSHPHSLHLNAGVNYTAWPLHATVFEQQQQQLRKKKFWLQLV